LLNAFTIHLPVET